MQRIASIAPVALVVALFSGCSERVDFAPQGANLHGQRSQIASSLETLPPSSAWGLMVNGGTMHSFEDARRLPLQSDADFAAFIDRSVVGTDRELALRLLKAMPPGMRGDFVYVKAPGSAMSNRPELVAKVDYYTPSSPQGLRVTARAAPVQPMSYPPNGGIGGSYLRYYSYQGINAAYGYASLPCDSVYENGDNGNMYFNAYDSAGNDVVDAGITQGNSGYSAQTEYAFVQLTSGPVYYGWHNLNQVWQCGLPPFGYALGIMYGTLPASLSNGGPNLSFLAVGIPDFDPTRMQMPPSQATWNHSAWTFFNTPPALLGSAGSWNGIPSPCMFCSVARMITIAQKSGTPLQDGSCFGACAGTPAARWDEVVMGEIVSPCGNNPGTPPSATCTIQYPSNGAWQNGANYSCTGIFWSDFNQQDALEGINTNYSGCSHTSDAQRAFTSPLPIAPSTSCTADSYGLCSIQTNVVQRGQCDTGRTRDGHPEFVIVQNITYETYQQQAMLELKGTATRVQNNISRNCFTFTWSPAEPRVTYNDPNLP